MASAVLFTVGTRGSPLALAQAHETRRRLAAAHGWDEARVAIAVIRTSGDIIQDRPLAEAGGKGLFTKEIDAALLDGRIDFAVHSAKDLPTALPDGVALAGFLPREDPRDALVSALADSIAGLPHGARLGAASLRRRAQALRLRADLRVELLRGNVETRLAKAESGVIDATLLAMAGLKRLGLAHRARAALDIEAFLPAVGQGAIALAARGGDARTLEALAAIGDADTATALAAERAYLAVLDGSCRTPIAGHARLEDGRLVLRGQVLREDGSESFEARVAGPPADAVRLGADAGRDLLRRLPPGVLAVDPAR
jgi:hydroxymethylbilane synthase